ncbi:MAG: family 1 glycosylhydrolase [Candidatus Bipolaricaulota bacterium]|nr:family 1 glycosylhydrolase [Candidatus Bipolaricaulota bacterium]MDW8151631.1 family 1 glycosylhydrolase [Candidatus Bipolaricaulota bacterium]
MDGFRNRWFLGPLLRGPYPADVWAWYGKLVPEMKPGDMAQISWRLDFLGVNYYTRIVVRQDPHDPLLHLRPVKPEGAAYTEMVWEIHPQGLYEILVRLHREYRVPALFVTENGAAFDDALAPDGRIHDRERIQYLRDHLAQAHRALHEGVPLKGHFVWSLLDNFEWVHGYTKRFGLVYVDFKTLRRIPKDSAFWYAEVIASNSFELG